VLYKAASVVATASTPADSSEAKANTEDAPSPTTPVLSGLMPYKNELANPEAPEKMFCPSPLVTTEVVLEAPIILDASSAAKEAVERPSEKFMLSVVVVTVSV